MKLALSIVVIFLSVSGSLYANSLDTVYRWPHMMNWGWGSMLMGLLFLMLIGLFIYLIVRLANRGNLSETKPTEDSALQILKERYARGEINKEDYDSMKKDLQD